MSGIAVRNDGTVIQTLTSGIVGQEGQPVVDATVTAQVKDYEGNAVGASISVPHVAGGTYQGFFPMPNPDLIEGRIYRVFSTCVSPTEGNAEFTAEWPAQLRGRR